jgi:hypothetical protein
VEPLALAKAEAATTVKEVSEVFPVEPERDIQFEVFVGSGLGRVVHGLFYFFSEGCRVLR